MMRPDTLAEVARRVSAGAAFGPALSEFLDEFYLHPERRQAMIDAAPAPVKCGQRPLPEKSLCIPHRTLRPLICLRRSARGCACRPRKGGQRQHGFGWLGCRCMGH